MNNVVNINNFKNLCCGCESCKSICKYGAIDFKQSRDGFEYPILNDKCINCGECLKHCQIVEKSKINIDFDQKVFSYQSKDSDILIESTSGGFFPDISKYIIENGGYVFGVAYDKNLRPVHKCINDVDEIVGFCGSKYVQSKIGNSFSEAKKLLDNKKIVLFSGTPCQIEGLKLYLGKEYDNLVLVDVPCYGVPSYKLFRQALDEYEKQKQEKVVDFKFRDKHTNGWSHTTVIKFESGNQIEKEDYYEIPFYRVFAERDLFRMSCYNCKFNNMNRVSDFTIGNYWNIEKETDQYDCNLGVSMVIINTIKAEKIFDILKQNAKTLEHDINNLKSVNHALFEGSTLSIHRKYIVNSLEKKGFNKTINIYYTRKMKTKIVKKLNALKNKLTRG